MLAYPHFNPIAFHIGSWPVYWYGIMYLLGFLGFWSALSWRSRQPRYGFNQEQVSDILFWGAMGIIIGGRLGFMIFYDMETVLHRPWVIFQVWRGGMSFHGGLIGVLVALALYGRKIGKSFFEVTDFAAPAVPIGLAAGRLGNFINGELWGRVTDVPWAMVFPAAGDLPRHPSQLYELALEGIVLFLVLWIFSSRSRPRGAVSGLFLIGYGAFRCLVECFREPDAQIGYIALGWLTKGQLLSLPMIVIGVAIFIWSYRRKPLCSNT